MLCWTARSTIFIDYTTVNEVDLQNRMRAGYSKNLLFPFNSFIFKQLNTTIFKTEYNNNKLLLLNPIDT